ncbi:MAG: metal-binding protein [Bacteroidetes bacterium]|nr:metal-binding protein [Bacteroidota bacterium]
MFFHLDLATKELHSKIKNRRICFGGNRKLKIYGTLHCVSGKRMKKENRVFFSSKNEAEKHGYRPCGHCMNPEYKKWKNEII